MRGNLPREFFRAGCFATLVLFLNLVYVALDPDDDEFYKSSFISKVFVSFFDSTAGIVEKKVLGIDNSGGFFEVLLNVLRPFLSKRMGPEADIIIQAITIFCFWALVYILCSLAISKLRRR